MTEKEKLTSIIKLLTPYLAVFPSCRLDSAGLMLYARALISLPIPVIDAAMVKLLQTHTFFPAVAEIFQEADAMEQHALEAVTGKHLPTAAEAWMEVQYHVKCCGMYKAWEFSCQEVEQAAKQFGKHELCMLEANAVNTARAQFMRIYESVLKRGREKMENQRALSAMNPQHRAMLAESLVKVKQIE